MPESMINLRDYRPCSLAQICEPVQWSVASFSGVNWLRESYLSPHDPLTTVMRLSVGDDRRRTREKPSHTPLSLLIQRKAFPRYWTRKWNLFLINIEIINMDGNWYLSLAWSWLAWYSPLLLSLFWLLCLHRRRRINLELRKQAKGGWKNWVLNRKQ